MALAVKTAWCVGGLEAKAVIIVHNTAGAKNLRAGSWSPHETGFPCQGPAVCARSPKSGSHFSDKDHAKE
jgi:hypothetical protein